MPKMLRATIINVRLPSDMLATINELAAKNSLRRGNYIRQLLREATEEYTNAAWYDIYSQSGSHLSFEDFKDASHARGLGLGFDENGFAILVEREDA